MQVHRFLKQMHALYPFCSFASKVLFWKWKKLTIGALYKKWLPDIPQYTVHNFTSHSPPYHQWRKGSNVFNVLIVVKFLQNGLYSYVQYILYVLLPKLIWKLAADKQNSLLCKYKTYNILKWIITPMTTVRFGRMPK